jgi:hypothetical protein
MVQQAIATPAGFLSRGQRQGEVAAPETLLLFQRSGSELVLLDRIKARDGSVPTGIEWVGVQHLASNFERIQDCGTVTPPYPRLDCNAWTSGLISTLQLTRLKSALAYLHSQKYLVADNTRRRHMPKLHLPRMKAHP